MSILTDNLTQTASVPGMSRQASIPLNILEAQLLSQTSYADECYINQRFSNKLQAYLVGYVGTIISEYSIPTT